MYATLQLEQQGGVGVLSLNVPDRLNAMSEQMAREAGGVVVAADA